MELKIEEDNMEDVTMITIYKRGLGWVRCWSDTEEPIVFRPTNSKAGNKYKKPKRNKF